MKEQEKIQFRLLTEREVLGEGQLDIFKLYGTQCVPDDYALTCGVRAENYMEKTGLANYWIDEKYLSLSEKANCIGMDGKIHIEYRDILDIGIRPVVKYSAIKNLCSDEFIGENGITQVTFSKKLSRAVDWKTQKELYYAVGAGDFRVEKEYVSRDIRQNSNNRYFECVEHIPIGSYQGNTYALVRVNTFNNELVKLSNGISYENGANVWLTEEPCVLLVDKKRDLAIFEHVIAGGVPYQFKDRFLEERLPELLHMDTSKEKEHKGVHLEFTMSPEEIVSLCQEGNITLSNVSGESVRINMERPKQKIKK